MNKTNKQKKERIKYMADIFQELLAQVDAMIVTLNEDDIKLLEEAEEMIESRINYKESAAPVLLAIGANSETFDEKRRLETLRILKQLVITRINYKKDIIEAQKRNEERQKAISYFRGMGLF